MPFASILPPVPTGTELTALLIVVCFSAGLNVYATVAMLGLLSRAEVLSLPPSLHVVENWYVIAICGVLFFVEFIGDKIPIFDLLWNAIHTFVRVPVAALLTYGATAQLPEWERLAATLLGALIALAAHGGKTAARAAIAHSPEPLSNIALSLGEDAVVVFLMWFATRHAYVAAGIAVVGLGVIAIMIRAVARAMRNLFGDTEGAFERTTPSGTGRRSNP
jgi:Domain of unknown function (DUF4126)